MQLIHTDDNKKKSISAIESIEQYLNDNYILRYNVVTGQLQFKYKPSLAPLDEAVTDVVPGASRAAADNFQNLTDYKINTMLREILKANIPVSVNRLRNLLLSSFSEHYNPFTDYFYNLPAWDQQTDHIGDLAKTVTTTDPELWEKCFRKWLVGLVASAVDDDKINHTVIVLSGKQGIGKTTWSVSLVPQPLRDHVFSGTINPNNKDTLVQLVECLLINLDELENLNRSEIGSLKEIITKTDVRIRRAYGHTNEFLPRRASFIASVNTAQFLNDMTGSRRFLCFEATDIEFQHHVNLDQVYAQALHLFKSGFQYWFDAKESEEIQLSNERFQQPPVVEELLLTYFSKPEGDEAPLYLTTTQILAKLYELAKVNVQNNKAVTLGRALRKHGFERIKKKGVYVYPVKFHDYNEVEANNRKL